MTEERRTAVPAAEAPEGPQEVATPEEVAAAAEIAGTEERGAGPYRDLYEDAPCGYLSSRPDGEITMANRTFLEWAGYRPQEVVGRLRLHDLLTPGARIYYETHLAPLLQMQGRVAGVAVEIVAADGRRLPALIASSLTRDAAGRPHLVRTAVLDASDRRAYERELLQEKRRAEASEARATLLARTLQSSLIPPTLPRIPGVDVGASYRPAGLGDEVGGDFYDVVEMPGGSWAVVLGDVAGKGAAAAVVTALVRFTLRAAVMQSPAPRAVLGLLNGALLREDARLCSVVFGAVTPRPDGTAEVTLCAAGHPQPLLVRGEAAVPVGGRGMLLGVTDDPPLEEAAVIVRPGDRLAFYTDGVTEGRRGAEWFGERRLADTLVRLRELPAQDVAAGVVESVVTFQQGRTRDDVAVVVLSVPSPA